MTWMTYKGIIQNARIQTYDYMEKENSRMKNMKWVVAVTWDIRKDIDYKSA